MELPVEAIRSRQNARVRSWRQAILHPEEPTTPWLAVEGLKQVTDLARHRRIELLLFSTATREITSLAESAAEVVRLTAGVLESLSSVRSPQQVIGFFRKPVWNRDCLGLFVLYLHELQDPGNLGTLLRTAWATGLCSIVTGPRTVSVFNTKVIRASAATLFNVPFLQGVQVEELRGLNYRIAVTDPGEGESLFQVPLAGPLACVIGSEGRGLPGGLLAEADLRVRIPMQPRCDSLNAGVAGSLFLYELYRRYGSPSKTQDRRGSPVPQT